MLYLLYVIKIGGDFYSGRFISLPLFAAIIAAGTALRPPSRLWPVVLVPILSLGALVPNAPLLSGASYSKTGDRSYINDERGQFYQAVFFVPATTDVYALCLHVALPV